MDDEIFTLILQAKNEAGAALEQMRADVSRMAADIEKSNIIAGQSFNELNTQTGLMEKSLASTATAAAAHASTMSTSLSAAARDVSSSFKQVESDFTSLRGTLLNAAMLTAPLAIAGGDALHMAGDYEAAVNKIKGLTNATPADLAMWNPAMLEMSKNGTKSAVEYADAIFFIASSNLHGADALHILDEAAKASTGGLGKMNDIAQALVGTLNAYVPQAERAAQATSYMDKLTEAVVVGHFDPATLAPSLSRVTPIASAAGVPIEDVLAAVATTTHIGGTVDQGTTGLRAILTTLMAPGAGSSKVLDQLGLGAAESGRRLREEGLQQYLTEIDQASLAQAGGDRDAQDAILKKLFPQARTALPVLLALTRSGGDIDSGGGDANFYKQAENQIANQSAGATDKANETALSGFNAQMTVLKNNVDAVGIAFGTALLPTLTPFVKDLIPQLVTGLTQFANDAIRVGQTIGAMAQGFAAMGAAVGISIDPLRTVEALLVAMAAMAIASVSAAIIGLAVDIGGLIVNLGILGGTLIIAGVQYAALGAAAVASAAATVAGWALAGTVMIGQAIIAGTVAVAHGALAVVNAVLSGSFGFMALMGAVVGAVFVTNTIGAGALAIAQFALTVANAVLSGSFFAVAAAAVSSAATAVGAFIAAAAPIVIGAAAIAGVAFLIYEAWANNWGGIQEIVGNVIQWIGDRIAGLIDFLASHHLLGVPANWRDEWGSFFAGIGDGAGSAVDNVLVMKDKMLAAFDLVMKSLDNLQGPNVIGGTNPDGQKMIDDAKRAMADAKAAADATTAGTSTATGPTADPNAAIVEKTELEKQLLDLKKQSLAVEGDMIAPQQHLRDLQLEMTAAAKEQQKLADEKRLLDLDAKDFNQNADLKRIDLKVKQDQENLNFTRSPAEAGALKADIERLQRQAHGIRTGLFPDDNARLEAELAQSGDQLNVKLAQNAINQQIAIVNDTLKPDEARKRALDDATKLIEHQQAVDKLNAQLNPSAPTIPITPRGTAPPISQQARDDWNRPQVNITINNPVMTTDQNVADVVAQAQAIARKGLEEAIAAGAPLPIQQGPF